MNIYNLLIITHIKKLRKMSINFFYSLLLVEFLVIDLLFKSFLPKNLHQKYHHYSRKINCLQFIQMIILITKISLLNYLHVLHKVAINKIVPEYSCHIYAEVEYDLYYDNRDILQAKLFLIGQIFNQNSNDKMWNVF
jgi:hypothetical protein